MTDHRAPQAAPREPTTTAGLFTPKEIRLLTTNGVATTDKMAILESAAARYMEAEGDLYEADTINIDLRSRVAALSEENAALLRFAGTAMLDVRTPDFIGCDWCGGDIQDAMTRAGLLVQTTMTEPCGDHCTCGEVADFPLDCFRTTTLGVRAMKAARSASPRSGEPAP